MNLRAAIYARVSTLRQVEEGNSLQAQIDKAKTYIEMKDYELFDVYTDEGISGKSVKDRDELHRMLKECNENKIDIVIVWKFSRLGRNQIETLSIIKALDDLGIGFVSISENIDTTNGTGKLILGILASVAEYERENIVDNLKLGMNQRARNGLKNGGRLLGYKSIGTGKDSRLGIIEEEAYVIRLVYKMYSQGKGYKAITNHLNHAGYKTVKGKLFSVNGIRDILNNVTYVGRIRFNVFVDYSKKRRKGKSETFIDVDGIHSPIVDLETWNKVRLIQKSKTKENTQNQGKYPLTGIMKCPECGAGMVGASTVNKLKSGEKKRIRYYSCGRFHNKGSIACRANSVRADDAELFVIDELTKFLNGLDTIEAIVKEINTKRLEDKEPIEKMIEYNETELRRLNVRQKKIFEAFENGLLDDDVFKSRMSQLSADEKDLRHKIRELKIKQDTMEFIEVPVEEVKRFITDYKVLFKNANPVDRKALIQLLIESIEIESKKIKIINLAFDNTIQAIINGESSNKDDSLSICKDYHFEHSITRF